MDVTRLVGECIVSHLPRKLKSIDLASAGFYESRYLCYLGGDYGYIRVSVERIPLDIIKTLRLVHPTFTALLDIFDLYADHQVDLFRDQYSAIMLGNHVFDTRWCAFPQTHDSPIYKNYIQHRLTHRRLTSRMYEFCKWSCFCASNGCEYCELLHSEAKDHNLRMWQSRPQNQRRFAGDEMWDEIHARENRATHDISMWIPSNWFMPQIEQKISRVIRVTPHLNITSLVHTPEGDRVGMTKTIAYEQVHHFNEMLKKYQAKETQGLVVRNDIPTSVKTRKLTNADLGVPSKREQKRERKRR